MDSGLREQLAVLDALPVAVAALAPESSEIRAANERLATLVGSEPSALRDRRLDDLAPGRWTPKPPASDRIASALARIRNGNGPARFAFRLEDADGTSRHVSVALSEATVGNDSFTLATITPTKGGEAAAESTDYQSALFQAQLESTLDGILIVDAEGMVLAYNARFLELWDMPEPTVAEGSAAEVFAYLDEQLDESGVLGDELAYVTEHSHAEHRDEVRLGDGQWLDRYTSPLLGPDERYFGRLWVFRDITERKDRERRLQELASVVSHDLRNPLDVAKGRAEVLPDLADVPDEMVPHLDEIESQLVRMDSLIQDMLTLATQGRRPQDVTTVAIQSVAQDAWQNVETDAASLSVEEARLEADKDRLLQLFENLFRNAIEHGGSDVTVRTGPLSSTNPNGTEAAGDSDGEADNEGENVKWASEIPGFFVADDGPGIPDDNESDVLEPGFSTGDRGTGLGLSIVADIARSHDWTIEVTESEDGGARFEFYF